MTGFRTGTQRRILYLNEITDLRLLTNLGARTQTSVGANLCAGFNGGTFDMRKWPNLHARLNSRVTDHAVGANRHVVPQKHLTLKQHVNINRYVAAAM